VLDAEAVAIDRTTGKLMPFQELSKRKRKDVKVEDIQVRVCLFAFDLLYLNGEVSVHATCCFTVELLLIDRTQPLLHRNLSERRELLRQHFAPVDFEFQFAKSSEGEKTEDIQAFLDESVKDGCEGLMVKMLESEASYYEPSRRSVNWLKVSTLYHPLLAKLTLATVEKGLLGWRRRLT
jgi:DNA ligase-1